MAAPAASGTASTHAKLDERWKRIRDPVTRFHLPIRVLSRPDDVARLSQGRVRGGGLHMACRSSGNGVRRTRSDADGNASDSQDHETTGPSRDLRAHERLL